MAWQCARPGWDRDQPLRRGLRGLAGTETSHYGEGVRGLAGTETSHYDDGVQLYGDGVRLRIGCGMDIEKIEELIRVLESSPNEELCVQKDDYRVCIKKGAKPARTAAKKPAQHGAAPAQAAKPQPEEHLITAPMVGMFHMVEGVARVGASVSEGQVVGSIESMKLGNDIIARISGTVLEVLVEDGMPIEYGQPLFRVG